MLNRFYCKVALGTQGLFLVEGRTTRDPHHHQDFSNSLVVSMFNTPPETYLADKNFKWSDCVQHMSFYDRRRVINDTRALTCVCMSPNVSGVGPAKNPFWGGKHNFSIEQKIIAFRADNFGNQNTKNVFVVKTFRASEPLYKGCTTFSLLLAALRLLLRITTASELKLILRITFRNKIHPIISHLLVPISILKCQTF